MLRLRSEAVSEKRCSISQWENINQQWPGSSLHVPQESFVNVRAQWPRFIQDWLIAEMSVYWKRASFVVDYFRHLKLFFSSPRLRLFMLFVDAHARCHVCGSANTDWGDVFVLQEQKQTFSLLTKYLSIVFRRLKNCNIACIEILFSISDAKPVLLRPRGPDRHDYDEPPDCKPAVTLICIQAFRRQRPWCGRMSVSIANNMLFSVVLRQTFPHLPPTYVRKWSWVFGDFQRFGRRMKEPFL